MLYKCYFISQGLGQNGFTLVLVTLFFQEIPICVIVYQRDSNFLGHKREGTNGLTCA